MERYLQELVLSGLHDEARRQFFPFLVNCMLLLHYEGTEPLMKYINAPHAHPSPKPPPRSSTILPGQGILPYCKLILYMIKYISVTITTTIALL